MDYAEDVGEMKEVAEVAGREGLKQSKGAARLFKKVNSMLGKVDTVVVKLESRKKKLQENIEATGGASEAQEGHLVTVQDLLGAVRGLQEVPDSDRLERISEVRMLGYTSAPSALQVVASMDEDSDGIVKVEHVNKVIEILGRDNVQLSGKQVKQIIDLIGKEEMLEVESKIEKILGKMPVFDAKDEVEAVKERVKEKVTGDIAKDMTENAGDNVLDDKAVEMNDEKMEEHMVELFSRNTEVKDNHAPPSPSKTEPDLKENAQVLSRAPRDNSVRDVTETVKEETRSQEAKEKEAEELEKIPRENGKH